MHNNIVQLSGTSGADEYALVAVQASASRGLAGLRGLAKYVYILS